MGIFIKSVLENKGFGILVLSVVNTKSLFLFLLGFKAPLKNWVWAVSGGDAGCQRRWREVIWFGEICMFILN